MRVPGAVEIMGAVDVIAGLSWDPEIRGFMAVFAGVVVLIGSVWLLLAANNGARLGTLLALAGFFGWLVIMASVWWLYGIGWSGDSPGWELQEINVGDLAAAATEPVTDLPDPTMLISAHELARASDNPVARAEFGLVSATTLTADQTEGLDAVQIDALVADELDKNVATTLSELAAVAPDVVESAAEAGTVDFGGWELLSTAEAGEAQASAISFLTESPDLNFASQADFKLLDAYTKGGKRGLPDDPSRLDRIWTQVRSAFTLTHPIRYGVVQVQQVVDQDLVPGQPPPRPISDPDKPVVSVVMVRNLGNLRLKPALTALGALAVFVALCLFLHERDKLVWAQRAKLEAGV